MSLLDFILFISINLVFIYLLINFQEIRRSLPANIYIFEEALSAYINLILNTKKYAWFICVFIFLFLDILLAFLNFACDIKRSAITDFEIIRGNEQHSIHIEMKYGTRTYLEQAKDVIAEKVKQEDLKYKDVKELILCAGFSQEKVIGYIKLK